jgi:hypothetical protein
MREAKILNVTTQSFDEYAQEIRKRFGTEIKQVGLQRMLDAYNAVSGSEADAAAGLTAEHAESAERKNIKPVFSAVSALSAVKFLTIKTGDRQVVPTSTGF